MSVAVPRLSALLSISAVCLAPFLCLYLYLLYLCLYLLCELLRCCICGCTWIVRFSVCVCYIPRSVPLFVSTSAVSVPIPGLLTPPSLYLWLCLGCPLFCLYLLCAWVCSSVCVCVCCVSMPVPGLLTSLFLSTVFVALPGLSAPSSVSAVYAYAWIICLYFFIFLL